MGRQRVEKSIESDYGESIEYVCHQHPGLEGARLFPRVLKLLSGAVGDLMDALDTKSIKADAGKLASAAIEDGDPSLLSPSSLLGGGSGMGALLDADVDMGKLGSALDALSDKLMVDDRLILDLLKYTRRRGPGESGAKHVVDNFDTIYQGNYGELVQAVWFALDTNYGAAIRRRFFNQGGAA